GGLLGQRPHVELGLVAQLVEGAVGGPVGRDLGLGQPAGGHGGGKGVPRAGGSGVISFSASQRAFTWRNRSSCGRTSGDSSSTAIPLVVVADMPLRLRGRGVRFGQGPEG